MKNYFNEYKLAKLTLAKMAAQFYDCDLSLDEAKKYGIEYNKYSYRKKSVNCCFHRFEPSGEYIWSALGIDSPIITYDELWDIADAIKEEEILNEDYHEEYLKMSICALGMVIKFYGHKVPFKDAKAIKYDKNFDLYEGKVDTYYHMFESTGETVWKLLGFEEPIVASSVVYAKQKELTKELLELTQEKKKTLSIK